MAHYDSPTASRHFGRSHSIMIASPASSLPSLYSYTHPDHHACGYTHPCNQCSGLVTDRRDHQVVDIHAEFSKLADFDFSPRDIFMVPSPLRLLNPEAFIPRVVPIGPYHSKRQFSEVKKYKILAAKATEEGFVKPHTFKSLLEKVDKSLPKVKEHYDGEFDSSLDKKLVEILALDASFILQVMRAWAEFSESTRANPAQTASSHDKCPSSPKKFEFGKVYKNKLPRPVRKTIIQDFLLLENQIPLFLLREVMTMEGQSSTDIEKNLGKFVCSLARQLLPPPLPKKDTISPNDDSVTEDKKLNDYSVTEDKKHLLDCLYDIFTGKGQSTSTITDGWTEIPTASNLCKAGIILEPSKENEGFQGFKGISFDFEKHTLFVPRIRVGEDTKTLFRNLLAYESHCKVDTADVLSYLKFMNSLIDTPADVARLVEKKIINKASDVGSDEEVACMFNGLCINTVDMFTQEYMDAAEKLNKHYSRKLWKIWSEFKRIYLSRPWLVVSLLSAAALLAMTLLITIYTLKLYYHEPPK